MRGINRQIIFEDTEDYIQFLESLTRQKETSGIQIYAYCLMSNHVHLLMKEGNVDLGTVFKRIGSSYVYWHNWKYNRRGHLFQDRYRSEAVEDDGYFLTVIRYIHNNPIKAVITNTLTEKIFVMLNQGLEFFPMILKRQSVYCKCQTVGT
jgi:REP element-mobilizing transposase RayT